MDGEPGLPWSQRDNGAVAAFLRAEKNQKKVWML